MQQAKSRRKPVPIFVPSPPPSPVYSAVVPPLSAARQQDEDPPPLPDDWRLIIAQANGSRENTVNLVASMANVTLETSRDTDRHTPRAVSPAHFGSTSSQIPQYWESYRPPTPPRHVDRQRSRYEHGDASDSEPSGDHRSKQIYLTECALEGKQPCAPSGGSLSHLERGSSTFDVDWQLSRLPKGQSKDQPWWEKIRMLGVLIQSRMKSFKNYGGLC
ncbi:hypothetical protein C8J57DRAFT_1462616 [Mycena rebaudengoi]|nr:hypothetical protein C8J57DRAFT_1462616 [Mycena rebaudengoi]